VRIIDAHAHFLAEPHYLENLIKTMDVLGIERVCLSGIGPLFHGRDNLAVRDAMNRYPDRILGTVFIRPGIDGPEKIHEAYAAGFRMIKITLPLHPYDHANHYPLWVAAQELHMPVLFHTGIVTTAIPAPDEHINSWYMHPMRLEPIANAFPKLNIIIAHLGVHWNSDAAELARMRPNVFVDLTGEPGGWRLRADKHGMETWLWWDRAFEKVVFGTDVHYSNIPTILSQDQARYARLNLPPTTLERIFSQNILKLIGDVK
jgi:predicted TIM-barrel fold metal-dependent hydrolase